MSVLLRNQPIIFARGPTVCRCTALGGIGALLVGIAASGLLEGAQGSGPITPRVMTVAEPRVVIVKSRRTLYLFDGDRLVRTYAVDLGRNPVGPKRLEDDDRTPEGRFRVVTKNAESPYQKFIGISYPDVPAAEAGFRNGLISVGELAGIRQAHELGVRPTWRTGLGGGIGLHGHRKGTDWTGGCVAMSDAHIDELFAVLRIGDSVEILP